MNVYRWSYWFLFEISQQFLKVTLGRSALVFQSESQEGIRQLLGLVTFTRVSFLPLGRDPVQEILGSAFFVWKKLFYLLLMDKIRFLSQP